MTLAVGSRVRVSEPISFAGGASPWLGRIGTVKKLLKTSRAVLVKLDDDANQDPFMFFVRELVIMETT